MTLSPDATRSVGITFDPEDGSDTLDELIQSFADAGSLYDVPAGSARNAYRASFAAIALQAYAERTGKDEPIETVVRDLLSDLRHLADLFSREGFEFDTLADRSAFHYNEELAGE